MSSPSERPCIGVFDSGFGGLTVLRALLQHLPGADYLYLGDTARLPYGSKSADTVTRYTAAAVHALVERGAQLVVIACNTASALALPNLLNDAPVQLVGVIEPGAKAAAEATRDSQLPVLVLATEATVASHAYGKACMHHGLHAVEKACPLLVPLVEEGWTEHPVTEQVAQIYLSEALADGKPGAVLLGCTHYPLLLPLLKRTTQGLLGHVPIVDSAAATAAYVCSLLPEAQHVDGKEPEVRFFATDSPAKFLRLGQHFLARDLGTVTLVTLDA